MSRDDVGGDRVVGIEIGTSLSQAAQLHQRGGRRSQGYEGKVQRRLAVAQ